MDGPDALKRIQPRRPYKFYNFIAVYIFRLRAAHDSFPEFPFGGLKLIYKLILKRLPAEITVFTITIFQIKLLKQLIFNRINADTMIDRIFQDKLTIFFKILMIYSFFQKKLIQQ